MIECVIGMGYFLRQLVTKASRGLDYVNERETSHHQSIDNESIIIVTVLKASSLLID